MYLFGCLWKLETTVNWKKLHNLNAENDVLCGGFSEDSGPEDSL